MSYNLDTQLPRVVDGQTTFSAADMNPIIEAVEDALSNIKDYVNQTGYCGYIAELTGFSSACTKGTIVALGGEDGTIYVPAEARWAEAVDGGCSLIPAKESIIVGVLLTDPDNSGRATVLCAGWLDDPDIIAAMVGSEASAGLYYLTTDGKAATTPSNTGVVVPCFTYLAAGAGSRGKLIFNPSAPEFQSHSHDLFRLQGDWEQVRPIDLPEQFTAPTTASRLHITDNNQDISELLKRGHNKLTLYKNGIVVSSDGWCITDDYIYVAFDVSPTDRFDIAAVVANTGITPYVDSITSNAKILDVYSIGGDVFIDLKPKTITNQNLTANAITELSGDGVKTAPVVHQIYPGVGITISSHKTDGATVPGSYDIHASNTLGNQLDFNITNLDGVIFGTSNDMVSYLFPAGKDTAMHGTVRAPKFEASGVRYRLNVLALGDESAEFTGSLTIYRWPGISTLGDCRDVEFYSMSTEYSYSGKSLYTADFTDISAQANDFIVLTLKANSPNSNIQVITASLEMYINE